MKKNLKEQHIGLKLEQFQLNTRLLNLPAADSSLVSRFDSLDSMDFFLFWKFSVNAQDQNKG